MSSSGTMRATMPLLPWRPAILSPTEIFRFSARYTFTSWMTPGRQLVGLEDLVDLLLRLLLDLGPLARRPRRCAARIRSLAALVRHAERLEVDVGRGRSSASCAGVSLVPAGRNSSTVPGLEHQRHFLAVEQVASARRASTSLMRAFSSPSSRRTSPIRSPRSFSTTWSSMRREDLHVDDDALHARRHLERRVLHVLRLLAEDRGEQLLFRATARSRPSA